MPWSAGTFTRTNGTYSGATVWNQDELNGFDILSTRHDGHDQDIATGINACLTKDGQNTPTANLSMGGFLHTNVASGTARTHYASVAQVQDGGIIWGGTSGGTANAQTLTPTIAIPAYVAGQTFRFIAGATNTGSATLQISGLASPKTILSANTGVNIVAGNITSGRLYTVVYDGTNFQLLNESKVWQTYTPTVTQGVGITFTNNYSKYLVDGKTVFYNASLVATSAGTPGSLIRVTLPIASTSATVYRVIGTATFIDVSPFTTYVCAVSQPTTTEIYFQNDASAGTSLGTTPAVTVASGDYINFEVTYEIA